MSYSLPRIVTNYPMSVVGLYKRELNRNAQALRAVELIRGGAQVDLTVI